MKQALHWIWPVAAAAIIGVLLRGYVVSTARVVGESMNGTLRGGDVVLVSRIQYRVSAPERGDVALIDIGGGERLIKRLVGLPGETVDIEGGALAIGGVQAAEPYLFGGAGQDFRAQLQQNQYLVMGDNRDHSHDGRAEDIGPVGREAFIGKVVFILWPMDRFGPIG